MKQKEPDEKELLEIMEMIKTFEQKAKEMCEISTANTRKWRLRAEQKQEV